MLRFVCFITFPSSFLPSLVAQTLSAAICVILHVVYSDHATIPPQRSGVSTLQGTKFRVLF